MPENHDLKSLIDSFEPPSDLWARVAASQRSRHRRRRIVAGGVGVLVAIVGLLPLLIVSMDSHSAPPAGAATAASTPAGQPPDCPFNQPGSEASVAPTSGPAGTVVTVTLPIPNRDENDQYTAPDGSVDIWWNADPDNWPDVLPGGTEPKPVLPGEVLQLGSFDAADRCFAQGQVTIPENAGPGVYNLVPIHADAVGATMLLPPDEVLTFEVRS